MLGRHITNLSTANSNLEFDRSSKLTNINTNLQELNISTISENTDLQEKLQEIENKKNINKNVEILIQRLNTDSGNREIKEYIQKIIDYYHLMREIAPIINTYSEQFFRLKPKFDEMKQLINELDIVADDNEEAKEEMLIKKREILSRYSSDIEILNRLAIELRQSSEFIIRRYRDYEFGEIERQPPESASADSAISSDFQFTDNTQEELALLDSEKTSFNPMDIAKYYKDMISNILR